MSYCRNPYYIYSDGDELHLDDIKVNENMINVFLYELVEHRKDELNERVKEGKRILNEERIDFSDMMDKILFSK